MGRPTVQAVLLAAGRSSRFKSETTKLLFTLCGQEMLLYSLNNLQELAIPTTIVVGYKKELIKRFVLDQQLENVSFVEQQQQRGTGDAVASTAHTWHADHILVLNGDAPLVQTALLRELLDQHIATDAAVSFVAAHNSDPEASAGYGRIVSRDGITTVCEARDYTGDPSVDCCVNAGIYLFNREFLQRFISVITPHENSGEMYLPDLIEIAGRKKYRVTTVMAPFDRIRGVNTLKELWAAEQIKRSEIIEYWMYQGVQFSYAQSTHIDVNVTIGAGSKIEAGVQLLAGTRIGKQCRIGAYACITKSTIDDRVTVNSHTIITDSTVGNDAVVGPFAYIHRNSIIGTESIVGNFVEMSRSSVAHHSKIKHLSYIGNADIGSHVNIGAGTIVCNYNGVTKHNTIIEDHAFIGSNNSLIAPVVIGAHAMTAAGSVIVDNVPQHALAIARAQQVNKEGYAEKIRGAKSGTTISHPLPPTLHTQQNVGE